MDSAWLLVAGLLWGCADGTLHGGEGFAVYEAVIAVCQDDRGRYNAVGLGHSAETCAEDEALFDDGDDREDDCGLLTTLQEVPSLCTADLYGDSASRRSLTIGLEDLADPGDLSGEALARVSVAACPSERGEGDEGFVTESGGGEILEDDGDTIVAHISTDFAKGKVRFQVCR